MARTVRMSRGQLRRIIREEASRLAEAQAGSQHDWDYYVHMTAYEVQSANEREDEWDGPTIACEVFRPSDDKTVRAMRDAMHDPAAEELIEAAVMKYAAELGLDPDELRDAFYEGLDATEEYMGDEEDEDFDDEDPRDSEVQGPFTWEEVLDRYTNEVADDVPAELQADIDAGQVDFTDDGTLRADGDTKSWTWNDVDGWRLEKDFAQH